MEKVARSIAFPRLRPALPSPPPWALRWVLIDDGHVEESSGPVAADTPGQDGEVPADQDLRKPAGFGINLKSHTSQMDSFS